MGGAAVTADLLNLLEIAIDGIIIIYDLPNHEIVYVIIITIMYV